MTQEEKVEELIKEGFNLSFPMVITDVVALDKYLRNHTNAVTSELKECFKNYTDAIASASEELTCEIRENVESCYKPLTIVYTKPHTYVMLRENVESCYKPLTIVYTKPHTYVMYRGIKIPTKGLYSQSKNKFTAKIVRKVYLKPMSVIPAEDPNDKHRINIDMVFNTIDQK